MGDVARACFRRSILPRAAVATALIVCVALGGAAAIAPIQRASAQNAQAAPAPGIANLNISPRRIIFTPRERSAAVYVFNQGTAPVLVDVALVDNVMLPSGELVPLRDAERRGGEAAEYVRRVNSASEAIIATPSRLELPAGAGKTVRLRAQMPDGVGGQELRTHLTVTSVPPPSAGLTAEQAAALGENELQFSVQTIFGISIPLFIRSGDLPVTARFGPMTFDRDQPSEALPDGQPVLVVPVRREGARSIFGNIEVRAGVGRNAEPIGIVRGVGVYTELGERVVRVPLQRRPRPGETLAVTFVDGEDGGTGATLAAGTVTMP
jgi:P pilus assembly chaperone PapD